jgi:hypothetical protein
MTDKQAELYAAEYHLPADNNGQVYARVMVEHIRTLVLKSVQELPAFAEDSDGIPGAEITIKHR